MTYSSVLSYNQAGLPNLKANDSLEDWAYRLAYKARFGFEMAGPNQTLGLVFNQPAIAAFNRDVLAGGFIYKAWVWQQTNGCRPQQGHKSLRPSICIATAILAMPGCAASPDLEAIPVSHPRLACAKPLIAGEITTLRDVDREALVDQAHILPKDTQRVMLARALAAITQSPHDEYYRQRANQYRKLFGGADRGLAALYDAHTNQHTTQTPCPRGNVITSLKFGEQR